MEFIKLLKLKQAELSEYILRYLNESNAKEYYNIQYINKGGILVTPKGYPKYSLVCIHMDTINDTEYTELELIKFDIKGDYISLADDSSCHCLGGDDRCGIFIALELIKARTPYAFGFFYDEEVGGAGSRRASPVINALEGVTAFIGLDRRGFDELALYGYDNSELVDLFERRGYFKAKGSFTDASNLSSLSDKRLACVNLSVGYYNEHTPKETINVTAMNRTLKTLKDMVKELSSKPFFVDDTTLYKSLYRSELYYSYWDNNSDEALEQWYIEGYNTAMEQGYELSKDELLYKDSLKGAEEGYIAYIAGFKDALYDMENLIEF